MKIELDEITIRDFARKDAEALFAIVHEGQVRRFMRDWSDAVRTPADFYGMIDWHVTQADSKDVYKNKRYAIVLSDTDELVGMVGMGREETLCEVEFAYFVAERYQCRGYAKRALTALCDWCFSVSDLTYFILTIDCANKPSCHVAKAAGFELFEKRTPLGHKQPNMESDSYYYYRHYREK